ncbi:hypothetical protein ULMS_21170 [Patiriisocius marinistellae]|uniref:FAS1 domain-containing protein n=1 Tax=Patiriisocius marinistellae TaxID=2494560 RepID=A0A5J4G1P0_9FLAO|nr:fasciclin domain-containing protein [Patiriisocius marinistellae]GEQ86609.1 hypothetical protein ULMS_21170 [Patiriisocius marinistellae]
MKHIIFALLIVTSFSVSAQKYMNKTANNSTKIFKGTTFTGAKTLIDNISESNSFTYATQILSNETLLKEIDQEEMVTVFVMTDKVFNNMDKEEREALMIDTDKLSMMFKAHSVPGRLDAVSIKKAIESNNGSASFLTLAGTKLIATSNGNTITLNDVEGNKALIIDTNFYHKNGFFHIVEGMAFSLKEEKK